MQFVVECGLGLGLYLLLKSYKVNDLAMVSNYIMHAYSCILLIYFLHFEIHCVQKKETKILFV